MRINVSISQTYIASGISSKIRFDFRPKWFGGASLIAVVTTKNVSYVNSRTYVWQDQGSRSGHAYNEPQSIFFCPYQRRCYITLKQWSAVFTPTCHFFTINWLRSFKFRLSRIIEEITQKISKLPVIMTSFK